ncbi:MAG: hypothetical protein FOGNACKC_03171 [Anaerolineae bacterium]|nr:hypothetical protein [Anaerolineae bacterium]
MKKLFLLLLFIWTLPACAPAQQASTPAAPTPAAPTTPEHKIVLMLSEAPEALAGYQQIVDEFAKIEPGLKVTINNIPDSGEFMKRLAADFAANTPPDVFIVNYRRFGQFAIKGALEPMDAYLAQSQALKLSDYYPAAVEAFQFDGRQYCLPQNLSSLEVYYNKNLFTAANVPLPSANWTWDDFLNAARALTKAENGQTVQYGLGVDPVTLRLAPFIWAHGGELVDDPTNPTQLALDSAPARKAFQWFVDLQVKEHVVPSKADEATEKSLSRFQHGTLAMFFQSRAITPELRDTIKDFEWDVAPLPRDVNVASVLHSDGYCLTASSKDKAAAWSFIEFANGIKGQKLLVTSGRTVPSLKQVAESPLFLDTQLPPANSRVYLDMAPNIRRVPVMAAWTEIEDVLNQEIKRAFYGEASVGEAISAAMSQTQEFFPQNQAESPVVPGPAEVAPSTPAAGPFLADVVLTEAQHQIPTTVKVGQIINVRVLADVQWTVDYRPEVLTALTPPEQMSQPGAKGWFFQVSAPGNTEIALESIAPPCPGGTPCPPNIMRFVFPIQAEN